MIANKYISKIGITVMAIVVLLCLCALIFHTTVSEWVGVSGTTVGYENALFNTNNVMEVNIVMDEAQWEEMLQNAIAEEYYQCDVIINGETVTNVGIRPKGNTSLSSIARDEDTDRYSFKLEFDHYVTGQTCFGLDKLVLNNNYADNTNMKEALIYDMYRYIGADAPLYNYAKISVNGTYWGVYLALEAVEDSFMLRNYGAENGSLYKPDSMDMGGGGGMPGGNRPAGGMMPQMQDEGNRPTPPEQNGETPQMPDSRNAREDFQGGMPPQGDTMQRGGGAGGGRGAMGGSGANLNYSDDNADSYSTIWNGAVTDVDDEGKQRVITALKNISEGNNIAQYMDTENLVKYMAVHVFSVNQDSLSGNMAHNYYLYENGGRLNIIPWDYNLAFGGMNGGNATSMINDAIDMPFSATNFFNPLLENEPYATMYRQNLATLVHDYVDGGAFEEFYVRTRKQIDELVATDPNSFVDYNEYAQAAETLYEVVTLRAQSIAGQLDGTIPSTSSGQRENADALIDAGQINLNVMGSMHGGDELRQRMNTEEEGTDTQAEQGAAPSRQDGQLPEGMEMPADENRQSPEGMEMPADGNARPRGGRGRFAGGGMQPPDGVQMPPENMQPPEGAEPPAGEAMQPPDGAQPPTDENTPPTAETEGGQVPSFSGGWGVAALLVLGFVFVLLYKRKHY